LQNIIRIKKELIKWFYFIEKIKALRPIITSLIENILSDRESDAAYKWGDI